MSSRSVSARSDAWPAWTRSRPSRTLFSALFAPPPCSTSDWKVNQLLYHLKLAGVLVASKSEAVELHWNVQSRRFHKVECYEASERVRHLIGELRADASFAASEDALVQRKTNKRALS